MKITVHDQILVNASYTVTAVGDTLTIAPTTRQQPLDSAGPAAGRWLVGAYTELSIDIANVSFVGGTTPSITMAFDRLLADGVTVGKNLISTGALSATAGVAFSASVGAGLQTAQSFGDAIHMSWTLTGAPTSCTFVVSIIGKA